MRRETENDTKRIQEEAENIEERVVEQTSKRLQGSDAQTRHWRNVHHTKAIEVERQSDS